jgi:uncharacterized membrane protein YoaK (UPF0700 family)
VARAAAGGSYQSLALACLSLAAGGIDVLSFLRLGNVFTSAMTGNTALLAIAIGRAQWLAASRSCAALLGFIAGVVLSTVVASRGDAASGTARAARALLLLELVFIVACAVLWNEAIDPGQRAVRYAVIVLAALSMGSQAVAARTLNSSGINTIVFTAGLMHIVMSATRALTRLPARPQAPAGPGDHLYTFAAYGGGALLAALLLARHFELAVWVPAVAVLVALGCSELGGAREVKRA